MLSQDNSQYKAHLKEKLDGAQIQDLLLQLPAKVLKDETGQQKLNHDQHAGQEY